MPGKRETIIALKATHTAYRVANAIANPLTSDLEQAREAEEARRKHINPDVPERDSPAPLNYSIVRDSGETLLTIAALLLLAAFVVVLLCLAGIF